jgi:hypothetical protein
MGEEPKHVGPIRQSWSFLEGAAVQSHIFNRSAIA